MSTEFTADLFTDPSLPAIDVRRSKRRKRTMSAYRQGSRIIVLIPAALTAEQEKREVRKLVDRVLRHEQQTAAPTSDEALMERAELLISAHLSHLSPRPRPSGIRWVGNQNSRWGSCTPSTGQIRISDRMKQMPDWVVDCVLLHELVHLVEPHHNKRFWQLANQHPRAERAQGFLEGWLLANQGLRAD